MIPAVLVFAGLIAFIAGAILLRTFGPGYRVGRTLSATPMATVAQAVAMANAGSPERYVKVTGRIDAETDLEDDAHRPLVFRRTRLTLRAGKRWDPVEDERQAVPFEIHEGLDAIGIRHEDLDAGLVVMPRESIGTAADVPDRVPPDTDLATPVRLLVQQVSSVEHAIVVGVPSLDRGGRPVLGAGADKPLILTTLEPDEAMRILAGDHPRRPLAVALSLAVGLTLVSVGLLWAVVDALL